MFQVYAAHGTSKRFENLINLKHNLALIHDPRSASFVALTISPATMAAYAYYHVL